MITSLNNPSQYLSKTKLKTVWQRLFSQEVRYQRVLFSILYRLFCPFGVSCRFFLAYGPLI
nr:MAG TPA: hypothetical protein [Caudoviricetes sp.]